MPSGRTATCSSRCRATPEPTVIMKLGPRDYLVLAYDRDEDSEPVYRVVKEMIKAASTAGALARKLQEESR